MKYPKNLSWPSIPPVWGSTRRCSRSCSSWSTRDTCADARGLLAIGKMQTATVRPPFWWADDCSGGLAAARRDQARQPDTEERHRGRLGNRARQVERMLLPVVKPCVIPKRRGVFHAAGCAVGGGGLPVELATVRHGKRA